MLVTLVLLVFAQSNYAREITRSSKPGLRGLRENEVPAQRRLEEGPEELFLIQTDYLLLM